MIPIALTEKSKAVVGWVWFWFIKNPFYLNKMVRCGNKGDKHQENTHNKI